MPRVNLKKQLLKVIAKIVIMIAVTVNMLIAADMALATGEVKIMKVSDVKVGMKGIGRTVVSGSKIEEFEVEILGVLKNNKLEDTLQISGSSFLVQVSGDVIKKSGGIAAGMSGSPVYIDGKLVGAVSSGWVMTDHTIGLLTPIEEMMSLFKYMKQPSKKIDVNSLIERDAYLFIDKSPKLPFGLKGVIIDGVEFACPAKKRGDTFNNLENGFMKFAPAASPLIVTGLNGRNFDSLSAAAKKSGCGVRMMNLESPSAQTMSDDFNIDKLMPGHAVAVQLVRGDINITAIGTLTYIKDNIFLAFGHSFLKNGDSNFFFAPANIYYCFSSQEMPFKIGAPGKLIGSVKVDRNEGIAGTIGVMPHVTTVNTVINDLDHNIKKSFSSQVVNDSKMFADLLQAILTQSVDEGINRQGEGFAKVKYSITGRSEKSGEFKIERKNYFYNDTDIAVTAIEEILSVISFIALNPFEKVVFYDVTAEFEIAKQNAVAKVTEISTTADSYEKGSSLEITLKVEPYYGKYFFESFTLPIPVNLKDGRYNLKIKNGAYTSDVTLDSTDFVEKEGNSLEVHLKKYVSSFKNYVAKLNSQEKSNYVVFEFEPANSENAQPGIDQSCNGTAPENIIGGQLKKSEKDKENAKNKENEKNTRKEDKENRLKIMPDRGEHFSASVVTKDGVKNTGRYIKIIYKPKHAQCKTGNISQIISEMKARLSEENPPAEAENYKIFKSFEYIIEPFEAQFSINIGNTNENLNLFDNNVNTGEEAEKIE